MADTKDTVRTDILINAKAAIAQLREMSELATSNAERVQKFSAALLQMSRANNIPLKQLLETFRQLNAEAAKQKKPSIFGNTGGQNIFDMSKGFLDSSQAAGVFKTNVDGVVTSVRNAKGQLDVTEKAAKKVGDTGKSAFDKVFTSVNAVRIALGALVSMFLFTALQAVQNFARSSIEEFTELEEALWRINVAEKALSEAGSEVSVAGLKKGIEDIQKLMPIFSEQDIAGAIGKIAISTKELGYTEEQIIQLTKAAAILNVVSTENEDINATISKLITALLSGTTKGISGLGVQLSDTVIKAKAVELQFIKTTDSLEDLTKEQKDFAKLAIVLGTAEDSLGLVDEYLESNAAKLRTNAATWDDLKTAAGGFFATIIPALSSMFDFLTNVINGFKVLTVLFEVIKVSIANVVVALSSGANAIDAIRKGLIAFKDIPKIFDEIASKSVPLLFGKMPKGAPDWFKNIFGKYLTDVETATDLTAKWKDELEENEDALKALEELEDKIQDIILDAQQAQDDLDVKLRQKQDDLDTEYIRKAEDAAIDHAQKLEDINQDAIDKVEDAKRKAREDEEKREQELLQKLKELRERFLLNLEDALHERDARQVLRLIKEYDLDKKNILDRAALDEQQRKDDLAEELRNIEIERQRRIESENIEHQRKLADLAQAKAREQEELKLWYKREQEDIQRGIEQKLEKLLAGYITEEKLHEEHQGKIYEILKKYFGKDMELMGQLTAFMAQQFAQMQAMAGYVAAPISPYQQYVQGEHSGGMGTTGGSTNNRPSGGRNPRRMASGGQFVATRPTTLEVGEGGMPELVSVIPLSKLLGGSLGLNGSGGGGSNSSIEVAVTLSPDLEARVINKAMDGTADVISRVQRSK